MPSGHAYAKAVRTVKTCVGTDFCRFGLGDAMRRRDRARDGDGRACYTPHKVKSARHGLPAQLRRGVRQGHRARRRRGRLGGLRRRRGGRDRPQGRPARDRRRPRDEAIRVALAFLQHYREYGGLPRAHLRRTSRGSGSSRCARSCSASSRRRAAASATGSPRRRPIPTRGASATTPSTPSSSPSSTPSPRSSARPRRSPMTAIASPTWTLVGRDRRRPAAGGPRRPASTAAGSRSSALLTGFAAIDAHCPHARRPAGRRDRRRLRASPARCTTAASTWRPAWRSTGRSRSPCTRSAIEDGRGLGAALLKTTCPYCGVGCGLVAEVRDGRLVCRARATPSTPSTAARRAASRPACPRPSTRPTARRRRCAARRWTTAGGRRRWRAAIGDVAESLQRVQARRDRVLHLRPAADRGLLRGQQAGQGLPRHQQRRLQLAPVHVQRGRGLHRRVRLRRAAAVATRTSTRPTCCFLLGSNAAACHPIVWNRIRSRGRVPDRRRPAPHADRRARRPAPARAARHRPPAAERDAARARARRAARQALPRRATPRGAEDALTVAADWSPERAPPRSAACPPRTSSPPRGASARRKRAMALWSMGVNQSTRRDAEEPRADQPLPGDRATSAARAPGPLSLTGQPNAMGGRETGGLADLLPGYRNVANAEDRAVDAAASGTRRGSRRSRGWPRPSWSRRSRTDRVKVALDRRHQPGRLPAGRRPLRRGAAPRRARDLPGRVLPDRDRRARPRDPARRAVAGEGRDDDELRAARVARARALRPARRGAAGLGDLRPRRPRARPPRGVRLARPPPPSTPSTSQTTEGRLCDQTGISHARLRREGPLQWPCPSADHPGTERLYASRRFATADGRARLAPTPHTAPADPVSPDFPLDADHRPRRPAVAHDDAHGQVAVAAERRAAPVRRGASRRRRRRCRTSRCACARAAARRVLRLRVSDAVPRGVAFAPFHWGALHLEAGAGALNDVTSRAVDPISKQPELKACAVRLEPVLARGRGARRAPRRDRRRGHGRQRGRRGGARPRARLARDARSAREDGRAVQPRPALAGARGRRRRTSGSRCAARTASTLAARRGGARDRHPRPHGRARRRRAGSSTTTSCSPPAPRRGFRRSPACIARACSRSGPWRTCARSAMPRPVRGAPWSSAAACSAWRPRAACANAASRSRSCTSPTA